MSELGELLELLYGARHRFTTVRGVLRSRHSRRLTQEAIKRESARRRGHRGGRASVTMYATGGQSDAEEPPDVEEETSRFWFEPPDRLREETEGIRTRSIVLDGDLWWMYTPDWGAVSNAGAAEDESASMSVGGGEQLRPLLDPSGLAGVLEIDRVGVEGDRLLVHAKLRDDLDDVYRHTLFHVRFGADDVELAVDRERGVVVRFATYLDGEELSVAEFDELVFDEVFPEGTFVFVPPPGEEVHPPPTSAPREYSLPDAAELATFAVFQIPELPEGSWRLHVNYLPRRERPRTPEHVALFYSRSDGRASVIVSQHASGEGGFGWPGIHPDGAPTEELERDGVRYTAMRADPEQGTGSAVTLEREGTAIQLQSQQLDVEALLDLAASLRRVE